MSHYSFVMVGRVGGMGRRGQIQSNDVQATLRARKTGVSGPPDAHRHESIVAQAWEEARLKERCLAQPRDAEKHGEIPALDAPVHLLRFRHCAP